MDHYGWAPVIALGLFLLVSHAIVWVNGYWKGVDAGIDSLIRVVKNRIKSRE